MALGGCSASARGNVYALSLLGAFARRTTRVALGKRVALWESVDPSESVDLWKSVDLWQSVDLWK